MKRNEPTDSAHPEDLPPQGRSVEGARMRTVSEVIVGGLLVLLVFLIAGGTLYFLYLTHAH